MNTRSLVRILVYGLRPSGGSQVVDREAQIACGTTWIYRNFQKRTTRE